MSQSPTEIWPPHLAAQIGSRNAFPQLKARSYLAHCAISPPSVAVQSAVDRVMQDYAQQGYLAFMTWHERREGLRSRIAQLLGGDTTDIGFCANTSAAISTIAQCFPWQRGDHIVLFRGEFPTNVTPWQQAASLHGLEIHYLETHSFRGPTGDGLTKLSDLLQRYPIKLVACSAVQFQDGLRMPLNDITAMSHEVGAQVFCDAIQALGCVPLDVRALGLDYVACGSHKWLMGIEGAAALYVAPERIDALRPYVAGWLSHESAIDFLFEPGQLRYDRPIRKRADFVEAGAYHVAALAALDAAIAPLLEVGIDKIYNHVQAFHDRIEAPIVERGFSSLRGTSTQRSGILAFHPPKGISVRWLSEQLTLRKMTVSAPDGCLRIAPHWPNALDECELVLDALDDALLSV